MHMKKEKRPEKDGERPDWDEKGGGSQSEKIGIQISFFV